MASFAQAICDSERIKPGDRAGQTRTAPGCYQAQKPRHGGRKSPEIIVRDDGGSWDLGYPNSWYAGDGMVGTLYYFNSKHDKIQAGGGVRHIARSIFSID
ncbi:hypothetical protein [Altererythrobacter fulvus]|uniref:hypothetical protein n=1 Tax=Caenibius fulvus TaxID=2126012 RepID=UPI003015E07F